MSWIDQLRLEWKQLTIYDRFEQVIARVLLLIISIIVVYTLILAVADLVRDCLSGVDFLGTEVLQDTFGSFLTVLILLEFNHSIAASVKNHSGVVQVRTVVLIAILVIGRKLILLDYKTATVDMLLGFGGVALALGILYWLLADGDRRREP